MESEPGIVTRWTLLLAVTLLVSVGAWGTAQMPSEDEHQPETEQPQHFPDEPNEPSASPPAGSTADSGYASTVPPAVEIGIVAVAAVLYLFIIGFAVIVGLGGTVLSCLAIYDCARRDFPDPSTRGMWCVLLALLRLIGAIVYYFMVYRKNDPPIQQSRLATVSWPSSGCTE